jgi:hypothetical protein
VVVDYYLDTRSKASGGGRLMNMTGTSCVDQTLAYSWSSATHYIDNFVLCPKSLEFWADQPDDGLDGFLHEDIESWGDFTWTLSVTTCLWGEATFIHELTHGQHLLAPDLWTSTLLKDTWFML